MGNVTNLWTFSAGMGWGVLPQSIAFGGVYCFYSLKWCYLLACQWVSDWVNLWACCISKRCWPICNLLHVFSTFLSRPHWKWSIVLSVVNTQQMEQIVSAEPTNEKSVRMETEYNCSWYNIIIVHVPVQENCRPFFPFVFFLYPTATIAGFWQSAVQFVNTAPNSSFCCEMQQHLRLRSRNNSKTDTF